MSEDPHDYVSMAPYFWPNADATDGLPYVRRDGQLNPEANSDRYDKRRLIEMARNSEALALAYCFTGNDVYAACCARQLRTWFLDPATRMTPHLAYAQVIPGMAKGRSFGVLDGHYLLPAFDAAGLLRGSRYWSESDREQLVAWAAEYLRWLRTNRSGRKEARSQNNHGTLFDVQVAHLSLLVGDVDLARQDRRAGKEAADRPADQTRGLPAGGAQSDGGVLLLPVQPRRSVQAGDARGARGSRPLAL